MFYKYNIIVEMDFVLLLAVLAIRNTIVVARPTDVDLKTKRSVDDDSSEVLIFNPNLIKFPTQIKNGFTVTINGTINTANKTFEVVFPAADRDEKDHCRIIYNFENKTLEISPVPSGEDSVLEYDISDEWSKHGVYPTFSIKLVARRTNDNHMFKLSFDGNGGGASGFTNCPIESFEDFGYIEFKQGLHNLTSLLFEFS